MAPASSIIFRMVPPWTFPAMLASSGRIILPKEAHESSQTLPRPQPSPGAAAGRQHIAHRLSCRAIAARTRLPVSGDGKRSKLPLGAEGSRAPLVGQPASHRSRTPPGPGAAQTEPGTCRCPTWPPGSSRAFCQRRITARGAPRKRLRAGPDRSCCFRAAALGSRGDTGGRIAAALPAPSPCNTEHGRSAAALCPRPVSLSE